MSYNLERVKKELRTISELGYVQTLRRGDTGIGQTLEQIIGLIENNIASADFESFGELKSFRKHTSSMMTMFTKEPISDYGRQRDRVLLDMFGYKSARPDRNLDFYTTVYFNNYNSQGFKLEIEDNKIHMKHKLHQDLSIYWDCELLEAVFKKKFPSLVVVLADTLGEGNDEKFHYNEAYYLEGFSFEEFLEQVRLNNIKVDFRMHQKLNGAPRNHGTAFRIVKSHLYNCFDIKERLV